MKEKYKYIQTLMILVIMILMATTEGFINIFGTTIKGDFALSDTRYSLMFTLGSIAYLIFNYVGGSLCDKLGQKNLFLIGLIGVTLGNLILATALNFNIFTMGFIIMQLFMGMMSIAANTIIPLLWITGQAIIMNLTHFSYGAGLSITQKLAGVFLNKGITWRNIYLIGALISLIVFIVFVFIKLPKSKVSKAEKNISLKEILTKKVSWYFIFAMGFYIMAEQSTGRWLPGFIKISYSNLNESQIASYISLFFVSLTLGRLIGGFIAEKLGEIKTVIIFSISGGILFILGLLLGKNGLYIISLSGFFFSIIFPTLVIIVGNTFKISTAYTTGVIISFAGIVNTSMNLALGFLSDLIGIEKAIFLVPIAILMTFIFVSCINWNLKNIKSVI
ncbi:MFS transporter [Clostridium septicum]|uniref:MFS transporter n=1 Tax=Clostridium septicum TaxID=1504 RepID=A0ABY5AX24_CLOSE|nr:MFS transporter [Clostridium septicum]MDU1313391.1 MFS transporter [Clostridium septicum]UEC19483.1 MFS transporter [Clostridium septicum]USR99564.1 MFS transporter [Clostridium septicum]